MQVRILSRRYSSSRSPYARRWMTRILLLSAYFWATHAGAELDLLMIKDGRRIGVEFKRVDAPRLTPSMNIALKDLRLDRLHVVYPGTRRFSLSDQVEVVPLNALVHAG